MIDYCEPIYFNCLSNKRTPGHKRLFDYFSNNPEGFFAPNFDSNFFRRALLDGFDRPDASRITRLYTELTHIIKAEDIKFVLDNETIFAKLKSYSGRFRYVTVSVSMDFLLKNTDRITSEVILETCGCKPDDTINKEIEQLSEMVKFFGVPNGIEIKEREPATEFVDYQIKIEVPNEISGLYEHISREITPLFRFQNPCFYYLPQLVETVWASADALAEVGKLTEKPNK